MFHNIEQNVFTHKIGYIRKMIEMITLAGLFDMLDGIL